MQAKLKWVAAALASIYTGIVLTYFDTWWAVAIVAGIIGTWFVVWIAYIIESEGI